ncbi:hypothetical protein [Ferruginibacter sp. HRS2-29]|uniref:hypothetical protein n=1 Tax=Ferruginibacter sp. HRS2-29 TaxID=2487334 RepID=UPI0020CE73EA|nr:hypothetical protein [Ferruginibacter sp. HRS2-29]MCP9752266.1 hypothetical protein [Ferruginibacter sp. HRS2-29]
MQKILLTLLLLNIAVLANAQNKGPLFKGMYIQWGYNTEWYTKSNVHFKMGNGNKFTLHHVKAHDKPDMDAILKEPGQISIPQYNYRFGFYLNKSRTRAIEINFDHIKYVVTDFQKARVTGQIDGVQVNGDSILNPATFLHLEHTDGGNLLHINYVEQKTLVSNRDKSRPLVNFIWKAGAGINIPRTDFTWRGERLNNNFHIAGYNLSAEAGARYYPLKRLFIEGTAKSGYVHYINALANTASLKGSRVHQGFGYFELIGLIGYDINF